MGLAVCTFEAYKVFVNDSCRDYPLYMRNRASFMASNFQTSRFLQPAREDCWPQSLRRRRRLHVCSLQLMNHHGVGQASLHLKDCEMSISFHNALESELRSNAHGTLKLCSRIVSRCRQFSRFPRYPLTGLSPSAGLRQKPWDRTVI
ncbi:hypothetical protein KP509_08G038000 [Ceratopteris richardii]|uniref:Uncharacterized protein n=1 Tax=Ceratopteris richardii TaxID=49495 RepID=A0A8T2U953_CERRI|nr:hypothetical protein KP509_08G038000 [Ceratopteris richardii]